MILQDAPFWWRCLAEGNQGLPKHGNVWRYHLGSSSYSRSGDWQMALRCFAKCSCRIHQWDICRGAQEACQGVCQTTTSLDPIRLAPLLEVHIRSTTYRKPAIYWAHLKFGLFTEGNMLPMGHCQVLPPLWPLEAEMVAVKRGFFLGL